MKTNLTLNNTGYIAEWWCQEPGTPTRYYTRKALRGAERSAARSGATRTGEHVCQGRPGITVLKACPDCGMPWAPQFGAKRCSKCRATDASQASANARRGRAV